LAALEEHGDPTAVLDDEALDEAVRLWRMAAVFEPMQVWFAVVIGRLHWHRYLLLPGAEAEQDLTSASYLTTFVRDRAPHLLPELVAPLLEASAAACEQPEAEYDLCVRIAKALMANDLDKEPSIMDRVVLLLRRATGSGAQGSGADASSLSDLGYALADRYQRTRDLADLEEAVGSFRRSVAAADESEPNLPLYLSNLSSALRARFDRNGAMADLDDAIEAGAKALSLVSDGSPWRADIARNVAAAEVYRAALHRISAGQAVRRPAVERSGAHRTAAGAQSLEDVVRLLATVGRDNPESSDPEVRAEKVRRWRSAVETVPLDHPLYPMCLMGLSQALTSMSSLAPDAAKPGLLRDAAELWSDVEHLIAEGDPNRRLVLEVTRGAYKLAYDFSADIALLRRAVHMARLMVDESDATDLAEDLLQLVTYLLRLLAEVDDAAAARDAVECGRRLLTLVSHDDPRRASCDFAVARALRHASRLGGGPDMLEEAVAHATAAVAACDEDHRAEYQANLGRTLLLSFEAMGDFGRLGEGVRLLREAVELCADEARRTEYQSYLARGLLVHHEFTNELAPLLESLELGRAAAAGVEPEHPDLPRRLSLLGTILTRSFKRSGDVEFLTEAVSVGREAVRLAEAAGGAFPQEIWSNLVIALVYLAELDSDPGLLTEMLDSAIKASDGAENEGSRARARMNLATVYSMKYERSQDPAVLDNWIETTRQAVAGMTTQDTARAAALFTLGNALRALHETTGAARDLEEAASAYRQAGSTESGSLPMRLAGHRAAARLAMQQGGSEFALTDMEAAIDLLPLAVPADSIRPDRHNGLVSLVGLSDDAVAAAVAAGRPERAVELLELTRGVLVADTVKARTSDLGRLRETQPALAETFESARARLNVIERMTPTSADDTVPLLSHGIRDLAAMRQEAYAAYRETVASIRAVDGFGEFLQAPRFAQLSALAVDGPIVLVSRGPAGCLALVLTDGPSSVSVVRLDGATDEDVYAHTVRFLRARAGCVDPNAGRSARREAQAALTGELAWIWNVVAEPVLADLGYAGAAKEKPPRLWWCPIGVFNQLPLHAAGLYQGGGGGTVLTDYAVSSYIPTLSSLKYVRSLHRPDNIDPEVLIVAVPDAPGALPLAGATMEAQGVKRQIPWAHVPEDPRRDTICEALADHAIVHFACHVQFDLRDPAASRVLLPDHLTAPLTVAQIGTQELAGRLAYLSACNTALAQPLLVDESLNAIGAFQLAGFASVIGSMWEIDDVTSRRVAIDFYRNMFRDGRQPLGTDAVARALHQAVRDLQRTFPDHPSLWAGYIHSGA
jgi:tetratricopeptide (TPR) repeat protein